MLMLGLGVGMQMQILILAVQGASTTAISARLPPA
jgi:hypothetical protein